MACTLTKQKLLLWAELLKGKEGCLHKPRKWRGGAGQHCCMLWQFVGICVLLNSHTCDIYLLRPPQAPQEAKAREPVTQSLEALQPDSSSAFCCSFYELSVLPSFGLTSKSELRIEIGKPQSSQDRPPYL